jgi:hypothetical protein
MPKPTKPPFGSGTPGDPWSNFPPAGGGAAGTTAPPTVPFENKVNEDPYLKENIDWIRGRRDASVMEGQKQRAYGDIDTLAQASSKGLDSLMARRGIGSSGISLEAQKENTDASARAKVRAGMDIDAGEQARQDALALNAANIMRAPSAYNLAQQGQNLGQWQTQQGQNNWLAQFQAQQQNNQTGNYMDLMKLFGSVPGGGGFKMPSGGVVMDDWSGANNPFGGLQNDPWAQSYLKKPGGGYGGGGYGGGGYGIGG